MCKHVLWMNILISVYLQSTKLIKLFRTPREKLNIILFQNFLEKRKKISHNLHMFWLSRVTELILSIVLKNTGWGKVGWQLWACEHSIYSWTVINYCVIFHVNSCKPTFSPPCIKKEGVEGYEVNWSKGKCRFYIAYFLVSKPFCLCSLSIC